MSILQYVKLGLSANSVLATVTAVGLGMTGCKTGGTRQSSEVKAIQGVPLVYAGTVDGSRRALLFYQLDENQRPVIDPTTKKPVIRHTTPLEFSTAVKFKTKAGAELILDTNPHVTYSWFSNSKTWTCADAEEIVGDPRPSDPVTGLETCYVEVTTTGDNGFAMQVIGFPNGKGLETWVNNNKPALSDGPSKKLSDADPFLKPGQVNARLDQDSALKAMEDVRTVFNVNSGELMKERNTCLKNQRAVGWLDISAHYFCQFPLSQTGSKTPYRDCYSRELIAKVAAGATNPHKDAFDLCWANTGFFTDPSLGKFRTASYVYLMWLRQGALDFKIEDENEVINKFYKVADVNKAAERPRRLLDTFPNWLPDQPRYNKIRTLQKAMQDKVAAAGGQ